jgi:hypothetical protein
MFIDFPDIFGIHKDVSTIAIGHGPSLNKYIDKIPV